MRSGLQPVAMSCNEDFYHDPFAALVDARVLLRTAARCVEGGSRSRFYARKRMSWSWRSPKFVGRGLLGGEGPNTGGNVFAHLSILTPRDPLAVHSTSEIPPGDWGATYLPGPIIHWGKRMLHSRPRPWHRPLLSEVARWRVADRRAPQVLAVPPHGLLALFCPSVSSAPPSASLRHGRALECCARGRVSGRVHLPLSC